jgi:HEAT repeat protein
MDEKWYVRIHATTALEEIGDERAVTPLYNGIKR